MPDDHADKMSPYDIPLQNIITFRLARLNAQLNAQAIRILKDSVGLSLAQWRVLVVLSELGEMSSSEIVRAVAVDKGQLSRTLKGMIQDGLINSRLSEKDHRVHLISLTPTGEALFLKGRPAMRSRQHVLTEGLTADEREVFFEMLDRIGKSADKLDTMV